MRCSTSARIASAPPASVRAAGQFLSSLAIQDALGTVGYDDDWHRELERLITIGTDAEDEQAGVRVSLRAARVLHMEAPEDERYEWLLQRVLYYDAYDESAFQLLDSHYALGRALGRSRAAARTKAGARLPRRRRAGGPVPALLVRLDRARPATIARPGLVLARHRARAAGLPHRRADHAARAVRVAARLGSAAGGVRRAPGHAPLDDDADVHNLAPRRHHRLEGQGGPGRAPPATSSACAASRSTASWSSTSTTPSPISATPRSSAPSSARSWADAARRIGKTESIERSIEAWKKASAVDPTKRAPRRALARVLYRGERWRTLADALKDEEARACRDDGERVAVLFQLVAPLSRSAAPGSGC